MCAVNAAVSFNEATTAAINALHKFILSVFPSPALSFARINKDSSDTVDYRVRLQALKGLSTAPPAAAAAAPPAPTSSAGLSSARPLDSTNMDVVALVVNIRGDEVVADGK